MLLGRMKMHRTKKTRLFTPSGSFFLIAAVGLLPLTGQIMAETYSPSLHLQSDTKEQHEWHLLSKTARVAGGNLVLDGRSRQSIAILAGKEWHDLTLSARFKVDPATRGVLACGFVFRASSSESYYYVHFDRTQAILVRSSPEQSWNEIKRVSGLEKPAGRWHEAGIEVAGTRIAVSLNGRELFQAKDASLKSGHIGFYANQGLARVKDITINGDPKPSNRKFLPRPEYVNFVVKDAGAGAYEAFPDVCRLRDGRLMCVFYAGYGHVSLPNAQHPHGGRVSCSYSSDEGKTWSTPKLLYDGPLDDRDPSIVQLDDGTILCNFFSLRPPGDEARRKGKSFELAGTWLVRSSDNGKSWSQPQLLNPDHPCSTPIRVLKNGELILGVYGSENGLSYGGVIKSKDRGKTWSKVIKIDNNGAHLDAETEIIQLNDGSLYATLRGGKGAQMHWSRSGDNGNTWTVCQPIGWPAHCPYLHRTKDGTIILAHRIPATSMHFSLDECRTWSEKSILIDSHGGAYPSLVDLKDGSVLVVYYEEGAGSNIRAKKFRVKQGAVEWLAW